ncbi:MAG: site-specific DNA-methyltransferase [Desulfamplus sp.]|nr:site-specific DNA-methyltransferase [Desulfamplus sp.]
MESELKKNRKNGSQTSSFGTKSRINHDSSKFYDGKLYSELTVNRCKLTDNQLYPNENPIPPNLVNSVIVGSSEKMVEIPDNSIHLMVTSPPYNVSKDYDNDLSLEEYIQFLQSVFTETYRVLVKGGRACINVANLGRKPYIPLSDYISKMMIKIGFSMRGEIIWNKGAGAGVSMAWGSWISASNPVLRDTHEYILIFSKDSFSREAKNRENTITKEQFMEWTKSVWTFNPESAKKIGHPAPFPEELPYRLIQLYTFKDDIILDPFMGSGTTGLVAVKNERKFVGYEVNEEYVELSNKRIKAELSQLKLF